MGLLIVEYSEWDAHDTFRSRSYLPSLIYRLTFLMSNNPMQWTSVIGGHIRMFLKFAHDISTCSMQNEALNVVIDAMGYKKG